MPAFSITTSPASSITSTTAVCGGNLVSKGSYIIVELGIMWGLTNTLPVDGTSVSITGTGLGAFTAALNRLPVDTTIYFAAYAKDSTGLVHLSTTTSFSTILPVPLVVTYPETDPGRTITTVEGAIVDNFEEPITDQGFYYNLSPGAPQSGTKVALGPGEPHFWSELTPLTVSTDYTFQAYATNANGTGYGEILTFTTMAASIPIVSTATPVIVNFDNVTTGGTVVDDGGSAITAVGVAYDTDPNPDLTKSFTTDDFTLRTFPSTVIPLITTGKTYMRAYATNTTGTGYGPEVSVDIQGFNMPEQFIQSVRTVKVIEIPLEVAPITIFDVNVPFDSTLTLAQTKSIIQYTLVPIINGAVPGNKAIFRLYGAGGVTPLFAAPFKATAASVAFDLVNLNVVEFEYDGVDFWYTNRVYTL